MRGRHRSVRGVPEEGVLEAQLDLAGQARRRTSEHETTFGEASQRVADVGCAQCRSNRPLPEDSSHDRGLLEDAALGERQCLDSRHEHGLDRVRDRGVARFRQVANRLFQEVGVALGPCDEVRPYLRRERARRE